MTDDVPVHIDVQGFSCHHYRDLGHLIIGHDGSITWEQLQSIKNEVWGRNARAVEIYPRAGDVVNGGQWRHLWRLGARDFAPDLLGHEPGDPDGLLVDTLEARSARAWELVDRLS